MSTAMQLCGDVSNHGDIDFIFDMFQQKAKVKWSFYCTQNAEEFQKYAVNKDILIDFYAETVATFPHIRR